MRKVTILAIRRTTQETKTVNFVFKPMPKKILISILNYNANSAVKMALNANVMTSNADI